METAARNIMAVTKLEVKKNQPAALSKKCNLNARKCNKKDADILLLEQELKFAKVLAGNDKKLRDRVLKNLRKWLGYRSQSSFRFEEEDFMRIWKGLFYCMWMSDKPLTQEELAENISSLIHCFTNVDDALLFFNCCLKTMVREWFGIDMHRLNKFMMFIRRMLRQCLVVLLKHKHKIEDFGSILTNTLLKQDSAIGLVMHFIEIYLEEIAKASKGNIETDIVTILLKPFAIYLAEHNDVHVAQHISQYIFITLLQQSDAGIEYQEKFEAWKRQGFPGGHIDCMQKVEIEESEDEDLGDFENEDLGQSTNFIADDPRAGHVDVVLPQIFFDASAIYEMLEGLIFGAKTNVKSRKLLRMLVQKYKKFSEGEFPLGLKKLPDCNLKKLNVKKAAEELDKFEQGLYADSTKNKKKKKLDNIDETQINKNIEPRKRKSSESYLNGKHKRSKKKNDWTIENLNDSEEFSDNSMIPSHNGSVTDIFSENINLSPLNGENTKTKREKLKKNAKTMEKKELTNADKSGWDQPLIQGEIEYFVPSKKLMLKKANDSLHNLSHDLSNNKQKSPLLDNKLQNLESHTDECVQSEKSNIKKDKLFINPFALATPSKLIPKITIQASTPELQSNSCVTPKNTKILKKSAASSEKKVKIVLKRNSSQNTEEYVQQLRSSPQIPYDAERKPLKTSLKPSVAPSRINPYYKFQEERQKK